MPLVTKSIVSETADTLAVHSSTAVVKYANITPVVRTKSYISRDARSIFLPSSITTSYVEPIMESHVNGRLLAHAVPAVSRSGPVAAAKMIVSRSSHSAIVMSVSLSPVIHAEKHVTVHAAPVIAGMGTKLPARG